MFDKKCDSTLWYGKQKQPVRYDSVCPRMYVLEDTREGGRSSPSGFLSRRLTPFIYADVRFDVLMVSLQSAVHGRERARACGNICCRMLQGNLSWLTNGVQRGGWEKKTMAWDERHCGFSRLLNKILQIDITLRGVHACAHPTHVFLC